MSYKTSSCKNILKSFKTFSNLDAFSSILNLFFVTSWTYGGISFAKTKDWNLSMICPFLYLTAPSSIIWFPFFGLPPFVSISTIQKSLFFYICIM